MIRVNWKLYFLSTHFSKMLQPFKWKFNQFNLSFATNYTSYALLFAQPTLAHFRAILLDFFSDIEKKSKWNFPKFKYRNVFICGMTAFKIPHALPAPLKKDYIRHITEGKKERKKINKIVLKNTIIQLILKNKNRYVYEV